MSTAILYTRDGCAACARLRASLGATGTPFIEVNLSREPQALTELLKLTRGRRIVPVLVRDGQVEIAPEGGSDL